MSAPATLDNSTDCVKAIGLDGRLLGMNPEGLCLMEIDDFDAIRGMAWSSLWPEAHRPTLEAAVAQAAQGVVARFSADCPTAKGTPKHWDVVVSPVHDASGRLSSLLSISRDVTAEVHVARERALVTRELAHRIANLFTVVDGIIALSTKSDGANSTFARALRKRISGLGRAVSYVYAGAGGELHEPSQRSVHGLIGEFLSPYEDESQSRLTIAGADLPLSGEALTPLSLIINELATNALKYGAFSQPGGQVAVTTSRGVDSYDLRWVETGSPVFAQARQNGFGTTLLDRTVALQLGGSVTRDWRPEGLDVRFSIPLERLAA